MRSRIFVHVLVSALILTGSFSAPAQSNEFSVHDNGLIYDEATMGKLSYIVDSLNLKYKTCDLNKTFYSKKQARGHEIRMSKGNMHQALKDMESGISWEDFLTNYPDAKVKEDLLIVRYSYTDHEDIPVIEFSEVDLDGNYGADIKKNTDLDRYNGPLKGKWVTYHWEGSEYTDESIRAFYMATELESKPITEKYARLIGYADCLIDTTAQKFLEEAESGWMTMPENWRELPREEQNDLLTKLRSTRVYGSCSHDDSPRIHAMNIAVLSAQTTHWETFLRAHLDIMNDRFDRASDGSYAWGRRGTYIRELEELDINIADLVLGISLRVENPAANHYYGSISRIGRALSETKDREYVKAEMLAMVEDSELDDFNRVLAYFLFLNFNHYTEQEDEKKANTRKLEASVAKLPPYLRKQIAFTD